MTDNRNLQALIDRFLDGQTTNAEEQQLYRYFAGEVAPQWQKYQPMFRWYAEGMPEKAARRIRLRPGMKGLAVAATVLLLFGIGFGWHRYRQPDDTYARYEGSYIIRNGQKLTDLSVIMPELQLTVRNVQQRQQRLDDLLNGRPREKKELPLI